MNYTKSFFIPKPYTGVDQADCRYYYRIKADPSEFFSTYEPCKDCIVLSMCLNKYSPCILYCPIVLQSFHKIGLDMRINYSTVVDIKYYDVLFWIHKSSQLTGTVELVIDDMIQCVSATLDLFSKRTHKL